MGVLDDAIREHLELKRQHGAEEEELKELEDEAFGSAERPGAPAGDGSYAEAPTEFMAQPEVSVSEATAPEKGEEDSPPSGSEAAPSAEVAEEEHPAMEHELPPSPAAKEDEGERQSLADQPTEMYDVESEFSSAEEESRPGFEEPEAEDEEEDFFDEKSLSDELDQALDAPAEPDGEHEDEAGEGDYEGGPEPASDEGGEWQGEDGDEEEQSEEEDVLEETPEFLQDAPESERLWFEQKPPKDFDFDD